MLTDQRIIDVQLARTARHRGAQSLLDAWLNTPKDQRAVTAAAVGDVQTAAGLDEGWKHLVKGDVVEAIGVARNGPRSGASTMRLLEAEALIEAGGVVAGLDRLEELHREGYPPATAALARHRHRLGDYRGAESAARALPMHAPTALIGARAASAAQRPVSAFAFIEPFLCGAAPLPEPLSAGAVAVMAASTMVRGGLRNRLTRFAVDLLTAPALPAEMSPTVARVAWTAGLAEHALKRFDGTGAWAAAARLELALLAGDAVLATQLLQQAGSLGVPSAVAVVLLSGNTSSMAPPHLAEQCFGEKSKVHVWRTHPHRWRPWLDAALRTSAEVAVYDLAGKVLPEAHDVPQYVLDDGSLLGMVEPAPPPAQPRPGAALWLDEPLCRGVALGADWPAEETEAVRGAAAMAERKEDSAVVVTAADNAFEDANRGRQVVAIAPPGDPFWAGPLPERVWPTLRVVRPAPGAGWSGAGSRVVEAARSLLGEAA